jgi:hypothetical protein
VEANLGIFRCEGVRISMRDGVTKPFHCAVGEFDVNACVLEKVIAKD